MLFAGISAPSQLGACSKLLMSLSSGACALLLLLLPKHKVHVGIIVSAKMIAMMSVASTNRFKQDPSAGLTGVSWEWSNRLLDSSAPHLVIRPGAVRDDRNRQDQFKVQVIFSSIIILAG